MKGKEDIKGQSADGEQLLDKLLKQEEWNAEPVWERCVADIKRIEARKAQGKRRWIWSSGIAASVAIALFAVTFFLFNSPPYSETDSHVRLVRGGKTVLVHSDLQSINGGKIDNDTLTEYNHSVVGELAQDLEVHVPFGKRFCTILNDGTSVTLNGGTVFHYQSKFGGNERRVRLAKGQAFFEVAHNPKKPFVVEVEDSEIKVLGTSFDIKDYAEQGEIVTTLVLGKIKVKNGDSEVEISPSEQAVIRKGEKVIQIDSVDVAPHVAWLRGRILAKPLTVKEVFLQLERLHGYRFDYAKAKNCMDIQIIATFDKQDSIEDILEVISRMADFQYAFSGNTIKVYR
ncbi:hypothetical protein FUAX_31920 [Fulvitalea axinellae]|uniref:FecR family protein n=1 Tax=Fulvitalea axinellae TaxID=1182444 RepID=A0AAU9CN04_9BACT|nr:hypothetical protein FUAX_31920 [Fulvitalea axinellae]